MSILTKHKENVFETEIVQALTSNQEWFEGIAEGYDPELGLYPDDLIGYITLTQPEAYDKMQKREGANTNSVLLKSLGVIFPAACGVVKWRGERIPTQEPQCYSATVPLGISREVSASGYWQGSR